MRSTDRSDLDHAGTGAGAATDSRPTSGHATGLVDPRAMGVFGYDARDVMSAGDAVRVLIATRSRRRGLRRIRRAGFRVRRWTPSLALLPREEVELACSTPGAVIWRRHDPTVPNQWSCLY